MDERHLIDEKYIILDDIDLGGVNETLHVLDTGKHSERLENIKVIPNFDSNDKRLELFNAPTAWDLVTEKHPAFWDFVHKDKSYKAVIFVPSVTTPPIELITALTDGNEFKQLKTNVLNQLENVVTNQRYRMTIGNGKAIITNWINSTSGSTTTQRGYYRAYIYDPTIQQFTEIFNFRDTTHPVPAASRWLTLLYKSAILLDKDTEVVDIGANNTMLTNFQWVGHKEGFTICAPGDGTQMLFYDILGKDYKIINKPYQENATIAVDSDYADNYCVVYLTTTQWHFINRVTKENFPINLTSSLPIPTVSFKGAISPDGTMIAYTNATAAQPKLRIIRVSDGQVIFTSATNAACVGAVWTKDNIIYVNTSVGAISKYTVTGDASTISVAEQDAYLTPAAGSFMPHYIASNDKIIYTKRGTLDGFSVFHILNAKTGVLELSQVINNFRPVMCNYGSKSYIWQVPGNKTRIMIPTTSGNQIIFLDYNKDLNSWTEVIRETPRAQSASNLQYYQSPIYFNDNKIVVYPLDTAAVIYNLDSETKDIISTITGNSNIVVKKLDETHFACEGASFTAIYRINFDSLTIEEVIRHAEGGQAIYLGYDD